MVKLAAGWPMEQIKSWKWFADVTGDERGAKKARSRRLPTVARTFKGVPVASERSQINRIIALNINGVKGEKTT